MKKLLNIVMVFIVVISLSGCDRGNSSKTVLVVDETETDADLPEMQESIQNEQVVPENTYTAEELVNMIESGELNIEAIHYQVETGQIVESEEILQEVANIMTEREAEKLKNLSGIMIARISYGDFYSWESTNTFRSIEFKLKLDVIDPKTGEVSKFKTFSNMKTKSCSPGFYSLGNAAISDNTSVARKYFNSDFTKMSAIVTTENGSSHVGWIDESGNFTDVSEIVSNSKGDSTFINHINPCFYDNYLYFVDNQRNNVQIKRVPTDNLSESAVEILLNNAGLPGSHPYPYPDGSVDNTSDGMREFSDESMDYVANEFQFTDWISKTECVGLDMQQVYKYTLEKKGVSEASSLLALWYDKRTLLVPDLGVWDAGYREYWSPVVSPEGDKVAFISLMPYNFENTIGLYFVPINGGDPVEINTSYDWNFTNDWSVSVKLLDWR